MTLCRRSVISSWKLRVYVWYTPGTWFLMWAFFLLQGSLDNSNSMKHIYKLIDKRAKGLGNQKAAAQKKENDSPEMKAITLVIQLSLSCHVLWNLKWRSKYEAKQALRYYIWYNATSQHSHGCIVLLADDIYVYVGDSNCLLNGNTTTREEYIRYALQSTRVFPFTWVRMGHINTYCT